MASTRLSPTTHDWLMIGRMTDQDWSDFAAVLGALKRLRDTGRMPHALAQATDAALERVRDGLDGVPT